MSADMFEKTKSMAANQGLYNGFLAAGLIWSLIIQDEAWSKNVAMFFLGCVLIAGYRGNKRAKIIILRTGYSCTHCISSCYFALALCNLNSCLYIRKEELENSIFLVPAGLPRSIRGSKRKSM